MLEHKDDIYKRSYNVSFNNLENLGFTVRRELNYAIESEIVSSLSLICAITF